MNNELEQFINAIKKNGDYGTLINADDMNIGLVTSEDQTKTRIYMNLFHTKLNIAMEMQFDNHRVNQVCDILRKRQADLPKKELKEGKVIYSPDERVDNGMHLINATQMAITESHADGKHVGLLLTNDKIQQGLIIGLDKQHIIELIASLEEQLALLD